MPEAGNAEAPCGIRLSVGIDNDLQVWLAVLGRIRKCSKPVVCCCLVAVRDSDERNVWMRCSYRAQIEDGFFGDWDISASACELHVMTGTLQGQPQCRKKLTTTGFPSDAGRVSLGVVGAFSLTAGVDATSRRAGDILSLQLGTTIG